MLVSIYNMSPTRWPTFHDLWPINGYDLWKFCIFRHCRTSHTKATELRATTFCQVLESLRGLLSTIKNLGKFVPNFFYFLSIDERPAMGSQPNVKSRSKMVSIYKCPTKISGSPPPKIGAKKHQILEHFFRDSAQDTAYLRNETKHGQTKMLVSVYNVHSIR